MGRDQETIPVGWSQRDGREGVGAGELSAASSGAPIALPGNSDALGTARLAHRCLHPVPETETHPGFSASTHTLGRKTIPKMSGGILLIADVPKIILKGTFNEINLFSLCFGFQGLFPRQKQLYGKLLVVKQSLTTTL